MSTPILATKLYAPPRRPQVVFRPRLIERLNEGLECTPSVALISAPAGFGKTTLAAEWAAACQRPVAWLSLDEGDNEPSRFLTYLAGSLRTVAPSIGGNLAAVLQSPQPPAAESVLTNLLSEIVDVPNSFALVLDDYHVIDAKPVDEALSFLLKHLPPQMHIVIVTREDPQLPLARLRATGQLTELRVVDLRFTTAEAAEFLNQGMGLNLSEEHVALLEARTEGWIAGLQLAAISMQGHKDAAGFITSFTGSHRFVMDYLVEEVLQQQSEGIQTFLLRTSILDRLCGPLCDAVLHGSSNQHAASSASGQQTLEHLEQANLFIIPLDSERRWYRYHHLFAELLRQRLHQSSTSSTGVEESGVGDLHRRASQWYEDNGLELEAFHHAVAANDIERAERLIEGKGMPLHFRGAVMPVLNWLESLPPAVLDAWPSLWTAFASTLLVTGQTTRVEQALQAAEAALQCAEPGDKTRDLVGRVAATRATVAGSQRQVETMIDQSRRALEYLHPNNLAFRTSTEWKLGFAHQLQGDRAAAGKAYNEVISIGQRSGNVVFTLMAKIGLGGLQEADNKLHMAAETYESVLQYFGDRPLPAACEAHLGLARICYEWNDLDAALKHLQQAAPLAGRLENTGRPVACEVFLARLKLALGDIGGAAAILDKAGQFAREHNFVDLMPEVAAAEVTTLLRQGNLAAAARLAEELEIPLSRARVNLAQGNALAALAVLESLRQQAEAKGWEDQRLSTMVVQAVAYHAHAEKKKAVALLGEAMALAEPAGFIRIFIDEGEPMARLLSEVSGHGIIREYSSKLRAAFEADNSARRDEAPRLAAHLPQPLIEPLSQRELEVLRLIAQGLSNREISERLFVALITVKGHNQRIFGKLQVQRRTEAVARARELGLL